MSNQQATADYRSGTLMAAILLDEVKPKGESAEDKTARERIISTIIAANEETTRILAEKPATAEGVRKQAINAYAQVEVWRRLFSDVLPMLAKYGLAEANGKPTQKGRKLLRKAGRK